MNGSWVDEGQGEFGNKTLYQQECIEARKAELKTISKRAGANPERYPRAAEKVVEGAAVPEAVMSLVEELCEDRTVRTPISMVDPTDSWATIEGVVAKLFEPASSNQQQVGIIEDESSETKLTVWRFSKQDVVLSEGDVVRIQDAKPGRYNGQVTLAVVGDTRIVVKERSSGRSPMGGHDIPEPRPPVGTIEEREDDGEDEHEVGADEDEPVVVERSRERTGVSWGWKKRKEAEKKGWRQRLNERKYNVPEWRHTMSVITAYRHQDLSPFGADERMVDIDLPPLRNGQ